MVWSQCIQFLLCTNQKNSNVSTMHVTIYRTSGQSFISSLIGRYHSSLILIGWLIRDSLKTLLSQNQTETESQTTLQFNGKEGICSETCEKFLTRSRRNAAPAATKKERFHHSLDQSEVDFWRPIIGSDLEHVMKSCVGGWWIMLL